MLTLTYRHNVYLSDRRSRKKLLNQFVVNYISTNKFILLLLLLYSMTN